MPPRTPNASKVSQVKASSISSSQKKMKQSSLLSFFPKKQHVTPTKNSSSIVSTDSTIITDKTTNTDIINNVKDERSIETTGNAEENNENSSFIQDNEEDSSILADNTTMNSTSIISSSFSTQEITPNTSLLNRNTSSSDTTTKRNSKLTNYTEDDSNSDNDTDHEDLPVAKRRKKQRVISDEDDDYQEDNKNTANNIDTDDNIDDINSIDDDDDDDLLALADSKPKQEQKSAISTFSLTSSRAGKPATKPPKPKLSTSILKPKPKNFNKQNEQRYQWLLDEKDSQQRPKSDPEYDPRTLYIPKSAWLKFTPFEKQYWEIKSNMWDCIVFFKKGKFFELYEKDALLANSIFDLKLAGGGRANMQLAGIPEMSFDYWASKFVQLGYKVAKVDQRESMLAKEMREGSKGIVKRELECVLTVGTLTNPGMLNSDLASYCMAIREEPGNFYNSNELMNNSSSTNSLQGKIFGTAFIDTSTGELKILEFIDDAECTKLDTLISQVKPKEVIMERNNLSNLATKIIKYNSDMNAVFNEIKPLEEFYTFEKTYDELISADYFSDESSWPDILQDYYKNEKRVGFSAFGGLLYYLKWLKLDKSLISMKNITEYNFERSQNSLVLDGITLQNLEIFSNSFDGSEKGTLFNLFNKAITPMGKRMMKKWLMHPLFQKKDIDQRLDSVESLLNDTELRSQLESTFVKLPDLERMLSRVHAGTIKARDLDKVIQSFETILQLQISLENTSLAGVLGTYASRFPKSLLNDVENWTSAYDREKVVDEGVIIPHRGVEPEFDNSLDHIKELEDSLQEYLIKYRKQFKCSNINFKDSGKEIYTIEIPISVSKSVPSTWIQMAANKSTKKYYSNEVKVLARSMAESLETHKILEDDLMSRLCKKFDSHYHSTWIPTIEVISNIDCLLSLSRTTESLNTPSCRPNIVEEIDPTTNTRLNGYLSFKALRHPCFNLGSTTNKDFIPNDIELGKTVPQIGLLTGANAAGKSTILRMSCIAVIMAQMGCYVPCESATLTPIDKIMTRLGANDNIMEGKSTFFVELSETQKILNSSTNRTLLVVDELGRGGSSSDGFAIAESVLYHVATHINSLGFFATHYGTLGASFKNHPQVRPLKMNIFVDEGTRKITFLYKMVDGQSEGSFGMHVASMCGISKEIVNDAEIAADTLEHTSRLIKDRELAASNLSGKIVSVPGGLQSDFVRLCYGDGLKNSKVGTGEGVLVYDWNIKRCVLKTLFDLVEGLDD